MTATDTKLTPAEIAALSNPELNEYVAKLIGWGRTTCGDRTCACQDEDVQWINTQSIEGAHEVLPYATSIDAQQAPGGPEEVGRNRGWELEVSVTDYRTRVWCFSKTAVIRGALADNKPEVRLRLEAWALALQEGES